MNNIVVNGIKLDNIDILDVEVAEKYEKILQELEKPISTVGLTNSQAIRIQCENVFKVFNELFGDGTDKKVFGDRVNLRICINALNELVQQLNSQIEEASKEFSKYSPNRAQRRGKK